MKKKFLIFAAATITSVSAMAQAQAPKGFNYQGVARNVTGAPVANTPIKIKLSIHKGISTGTVAYAETHSVTTNTFGLYNVIVGTGTVVNGAFDLDAWGSAAVYMQVEVDPTGTGTSYVDLGSSQLMSVPYALFAANGPVGPTGPAGPPGTPGAGSVVSVTAGTGLTGGTITTTGTIAMPSVGTAGTYGSATTIPVITVDAQGRVTKIVPTTTGDNWGTQSVNADASFTGTGTPLSPLKINSTGASLNDVLTYNGATWAPAAPPLGDNWGGQSVVTDATFTGDGTTGAPLKINSTGATAGDALVFNGTTWSPAPTSGTGTVTNVNTTAPLTGGPFSTTGTIGLANSGVVAATYGSSSQIPVMTVDVFGRVTAASLAPASTLSGTPSHLVKFTSTNTGGNSSLIDSNMGLLYNSGSYLVNTSPASNKFYYRAVPGSGTAANWFSFGGDLNGFSVLTVSDSSIGATAKNKAILLASSQELNKIATGSATGKAFGIIYNEPGDVATITNGAGTLNAQFHMLTGNFDVLGFMTKGGGTFKIDHPLDPENKYLYHSFVESPDMMNIYNGNVTTDLSGIADVTLPSYFEALNKDFRYQLTVIGTFAQAIVSEEVAGNHFQIKTSVPNVKVSWQVTGVRHDKLAEERRIVPEVEKEANDKGKYLYPNLYGQPASKGIGYDATKLTNGAVQLK